MQAIKMRCYQRILNILYKDHITNEEVSRKIQAAIGEYDNRGEEMETKVAWLCQKAFLFSKEDSTVQKGKG